MSKRTYGAWSRPRACLVCGEELPSQSDYSSWLCPDCPVQTDADAMRPRPADLTSVLGLPPAS